MGIIYKRNKENGRIQAIKKVARNCKCCGVTFYKLPGYLKKNKALYCSYSCAAKMTRNMKGKKISLKGRMKMRAAKLGKFGPLANNWQGGRVDIVRSIRKSSTYKIWRREVLERDNYECQLCGEKDNIQVHHIKSLAKNIHLKDELSNGQVLCSNCHAKEDKYYYRFIYKTL